MKARARGDRCVASQVKNTTIGNKTHVPCKLVDGARIAALAGS